MEIHGALDRNVRYPFDVAIAKAKTALGEAAFQALIAQNTEA